MPQPQTPSKPQKGDKTQEELELERLIAQASAATPEQVRNISTSRARDFLRIMHEIGIGEIMNAVIRDQRSEEGMMKPVTAAQQGSRAIKASGLLSAAERIREVQLKIDYQELTDRLIQGDVFDRLVCVVLDVEDADKANFSDFGDVLPFFLTRFSRLYAGLTSFIVQSV